MANGTPSPNGSRLQPPAQPQQIQRTRTTIVHLFGIEIHELPDGGRQVDVVTPGGEVMSLAMDADMAKQVGERLLAPSVAVPKVALN